MSGISVRALQPADFDAWQPLWQGYLTFYESSVPDEVTRLTWARFHDPVETTYALGAFADEALLGFAHYHIQRSTWAPTGYVYLEDLFTAEQARGRGAGRALIEAVRDRAEAMGASRLHWTTQTGNATARRLYDSLASVAGFVQYRLPL